MTGNKVGVVLSGKPLAVLLDGCEIDSNLGAGVVVERSAEPWMQGCRITQNGTHGVMVERAANPTLWHCIMRHNASNGLFINAAQVPLPNVPGHTACTDHPSAGPYLWTSTSFFSFFITNRQGPL